MGGLKVQGGSAVTIKRHPLSLRFGRSRKDRNTTGFLPHSVPRWAVAGRFVRSASGPRGRALPTNVAASAACSPPWPRSIATCNCRRSGHIHPRRVRALRSVQAINPDPARFRSHRRNMRSLVACSQLPSWYWQSFRVAWLCSVGAWLRHVRILDLSRVIFN